MRLGRFHVFAFVVISLQLAVSTAAQSPSPNSDWETLRPEGEEFSVLMPKGATFESSKEPYHKMELNTRTYISRSPAGPVFAIVSLSGIKSNPAAYTEMQRVNSYVDAFKRLLAKKIKGKDAVGKLTLVGDKKLYGHLGREYRMTIGELTGTANVYATRRRFYAIVFLNSKKDEALEEQFISSFSLPEKIAEAPPPPVAQNPPADTAPGTKPVVEAELPANPSEAKPAEPAGTTPDNPAEEKKRAPIHGGVLNGKALSLPRPQYTPEARAAGVSGVVTVQVTIDEMGNVIAANAVSGHPLLQKSAVNAALQAKFSPTTLMGEPVKVTGVITYNFVLQN